MDPETLKKRAIEEGDPQACRVLLALSIREGEWRTAHEALVVWLQEVSKVLDEDGGMEFVGAQRHREFAAFLSVGMGLGGLVGEAFVEHVAGLAQTGVSPFVNPHNRPGASLVASISSGLFRFLLDGELVPFVNFPRLPDLDAAVQAFRRAREAPRWSEDAARGVMAFHPETGDEIQAAIRANERANEEFLQAMWEEP
jgi:hypothetical protein